MAVAVKTGVRIMIETMLLCLIVNPPFFASSFHLFMESLAIKASENKG
jgi:hypothetical protein